MHVIHRRGWEIPENRATPEHVFFNRRAFMAGAGAIGAAGLLPHGAQAQQADPSAALYPARRNEAYALDRPLTPEDVTSRYNNFYEFGSTKNIAAAAQRLETRPWLIKIDGLVAKEREIGIDDLLKAVQLEERLYRLRCVEA